ncbi:MAG: D-alanyl-D-alanine carboxypeptidase [Oscillospiraceae bacterium]|nr:D-alanyl-D-alanine carboxypeptidase [Oscillospiraceae bacterium]
MKQILSLFMAITLCLSLSVTAFAEETAIQSAVPATVSNAYVVMNAETGQILVQKNMDEKEYPASITKVLTAAIALDIGNPRDQYEITADDVFSYTFPGTTYVALTHDEVVTVEQLLYGTLMASANDAANCLGSYVATKLGRTALNDKGEESYVSGFVEILNEKLEELGCTNTHFTNAHGLHNEDHYTTAADMAKILQYALSVDGFRDYFGAVSYTMAATNMQPQERSWGTQSGLFVESNKYYYEGATGAKLGYTDEAGHTMVSVAERNDVELICVLLDCQQGNWADHRDSATLYDYCFNNFDTVTFTAEDLKQKSVPVYKENEIYEKAQITAGSDYSMQLHKLLTKSDVKFATNVPGRFFYGESMSATLSFALTKSATKTVGEAMYTDLGSMPLKVTVVPLTEEEPSMMAKVGSFLLSAVKVLAVVLVIFMVLILLLRAYNIRRYKKIREKRRQRQLEREKMNKQ